MLNYRTSNSIQKKLLFKFLGELLESKNFYHSNMPLITRIVYLPLFFVSFSSLYYSLVIGKWQFFSYSEIRTIHIQINLLINLNSEWIIIDKKVKLMKITVKFEISKLYLAKKNTYFTLFLRSLKFRKKFSTSKYI